MVSVRRQKTPPSASITGLNTKMIDIVLQGAANNYTAEIANHYAQLPFVESVIISCWSGDQISPDLDPKIKIIKSKDVAGGDSNRNRQIVSSLAGIKAATCETVVKMRGDQKVSLESMEMMNDYYDGNRIHVASLFKAFPFHPCDHWFWGPKDLLIQLFDIPLDTSSNEYSGNWDVITRAETYIAMWYAAINDQRVIKMVENPQKYLVDNAPHREEAIAVSNEIIEDLFRPFPRAHFDWPKHYAIDYFYFQNPYGETFG